MNLKSLMQMAKAHGLTFRKSNNGLWRVSRDGQRNETAYYTRSFDEAVSKLHEMVQATKGKTL